MRLKSRELKEPLRGWIWFLLSSRNNNFSKNITKFFFKSKLLVPKIKGELGQVGGIKTLLFSMLKFHHVVKGIKCMLFAYLIGFGVQKILFLKRRFKSFSKLFFAPIKGLIMFCFLQTI